MRSEVFSCVINIKIGFQKTICRTTVLHFRFTCYFEIGFSCSTRDNLYRTIQAKTVYLNEIFSKLSSPISSIVRGSIELVTKRSAKDKKGEELKQIDSPEKNKSIILENKKCSYRISLASLKEIR